jgi:hypothetical protein
MVIVEMLESELESLLRHLAGDGTRLSISKLYFLSHMTGEEAERLRQLWPEIPLRRRRQIVSHLVDIAEASFEVDFNALFRFCLQDEDEQVRAQAIEGLWEDNDIVLIGPFVRILRDDPSPVARAAAATALGRFVLMGELGQIEAAPAGLVEQVLLQTIHTPEEEVEVRRRAVESIAYSGELGVRDIIETAYYDDNLEMRCSAIFAMGRSADPFWRDLVISELDNPNPGIRFESAQACGKLEARAAIPRLAQLLEEETDREVLEAAIEALGQIGGAEARRLLEACFETDDEVLHDAASAALEELEFSGDLVGIPLYGEEEDYDWGDEEEEDYDWDDEEE